MKTLVVRQTLPNGSARTWRLRPDGKPVTLGKSRLAKLSSMDPASNGIEGAFEHAKGQWTWISMNQATLQQDPVTVLKDDTVVALAGSELRFGFHVKDDTLYSKIQTATAAEPALGTSAYELEIVKFDDRVLSTQVMKAGAKESNKARAAKLHGAGKITVVRRPIHLAATKDLTRANPGAAMDKEAKRGTLIVAVCSVLFSAGAVFGPRSSVESVEVLPPIPRPVTISMNAVAPMKQKKGNPIEQKQKSPAPSPSPSAGSQDSKPAGGKVAGMLKSVTGGRLSQLLGKVSAQAARSREVVIANGVKAGDGPSGRTLAALGRVDRGGGDWSAAANGTGVTVSTAGRGGGKGLSGMGGLSAGNTGSAGVGLIEDESEITGGLDREVIAQTIKTYLGQILYCYERQLSASPDLFGKVAVRFTIGASGAVEAQAIGNTTLKNATVEGCILNKVAAWKFPAPQGGTKVTVTYPFLFKSTN